MAVKIRFSRIGKTHAPFYRIIAIDSQSKRDGKALDILGTYNPITGEILQFHTDKIQEWVSKGAVVTDAVKRLQKIHKKTVGVTASVAK
jgi:small subunit ribosomal protein S16